MARGTVDAQAGVTAYRVDTFDPTLEPNAPPLHALPFHGSECHEQQEPDTVARLTELRHWWWAGLISDGEYREKEEEILLGRQG